MEETHETTTRKPPAWLTATALAGSMLLGAHFVKTALHLTPTSLVGVEYGEVGNAYFTPFFNQRWALFAPDPPLRDFYVEFKCMDAEGNELWLSGYGDLLDDHRRVRISPASYLRRVNRSVTFGVLGTPDPSYDALVESLEDPDEGTVRYVAAVATQKKRISMLGRHNGYRLAWHECAQVVSDLAAVRLRVPSIEVPKFTDRNADIPRSVVAHGIPWMTRAEIDELPARVAREVVTDEDVRAMVAKKRQGASTSSSAANHSGVDKSALSPGASGEDKE